MTIKVNGSGNRVAGRDYIENNTRPCPICEDRQVEQHRDMCRHCRDEMLRTERNFRWMVGGVSAFAIAGVYMKWKAPADTPVDIWLLSESVLVGTVAVIVAVAIYRTLIVRMKD